MNAKEYGYCQICNKPKVLNRKYYYYNIKCECCGSKDNEGKNQHFVIVFHCDECTPKPPMNIRPVLNMKPKDSKLNE